jgi:hypothetical protein
MELAISVLLSTVETVKPLEILLKVLKWSYQYVVGSSTFGGVYSVAIKLLIFARGVLGSEFVRSFGSDSCVLI